MSCPNPPARENAHVLSFDKTSCTAVYACDTGYSMVGSGVAQGTTAPTTAWSTDVNCELAFIKNGKLSIRYISYIFFLYSQGNEFVLNVHLKTAIMSTPGV